MGRIVARALPGCCRHSSVDHSVSRVIVVAVVVDLLDEGVESGEGRVDWGDGLLSVDHLSAGHVGEHLPTTQQIGVGDGFSPHVLPGPIELCGTRRT